MPDGILEDTLLNTFFKKHLAKLFISGAIIVGGISLTADFYFLEKMSSLSATVSSIVPVVNRNTKDFEDFNRFESEHRDDHIEFQSMIQDEFLVMNTFIAKTFTTI